MAEEERRIGTKELHSTVNTLVTEQAVQSSVIRGMKKTCDLHLSDFKDNAGKDTLWKEKAAYKFGAIHTNLKWGIIVITLILSGILGSNIFGLFAK